MPNDEFHGAAGPLAVTLHAAYTNLATGFAVNLIGAVSGHATSNQWNFGDGAGFSNRPYTSHNWVAAGDYLVVFSAYNDTNPGGVSATVAVHVVSQPVHYVSAASATPAGALHLLGERSHDDPGRGGRCVCRGSPGPSHQWHLSIRRKTGNRRADESCVGRQASLRQQSQRSIPEVSEKYIKTEKGMFHRETGLSAKPGDTARLSADPKDLQPLLQQLENESGEQFPLDETFNAAVALALTKRKK